MAHKTIPDVSVFNSVLECRCRESNAYIAAVESSKQQLWSGLPSTSGRSSRVLYLLGSTCSQQAIRLNVAYLPRCVVFTATL